MHSSHSLPTQVFPYPLQVLPSQCQRSPEQDLEVQGALLPDYSTCLSPYIPRGCTGVLNKEIKTQPAVRRPDGDQATARSSILDNFTPLSSPHADASASAQYRDFAGGATTLSDVQDRAASSLMSATLGRRLPVLNIQYGVPLPSISGPTDFWGQAVMRLCTCASNSQSTARSLSV